LGHGDCNDVFIPQPINALSGRNVVKVACGDTHTLAVTAEGELFSFGRNQNGQLGLGTTSDAILPQPVESLKVTFCPCALHHKCHAQSTYIFKNCHLSFRMLAYATGCFTLLLLFFAVPTCLTSTSRHSM
jgi:alpha-tubulin suppressor-like RCC1 family protein